MTQANPDGLLRHGGRTDEAARRFPAAPRPWLDLSTGINPTPWAPQSPLDSNPGPLPTAADLHRLEAAAAQCFGTCAQRVAAVPGSDIAIRLLPTLLGGVPITAVSPGYASHLDVADRHVPPGDPGAASAREGALLLANPSNPQGRLLAVPQLLKLAGSRPGQWLVVDEAFADALQGASLLPHLHADEQIVVLRSFGKFFGLAGLRLGFVVGPPAIVAGVRRLLGDWPVSAQAISWGAAAYGDQAWALAARARLRAQADMLDALLARHGLAGTGDCPLFRLVQHADAPRIFLRLAHAGVLVRPFRDQPGWLRFGLPADTQAMERLDRALGLG